MNLSSALLGKQLGVEGFFFGGGEGVSGPHLPTFGLNKFPYLVKMRENADQKNSKYRHFLRSVFKSSSMFFADQSHVNFIFYLVLVFTALRNSDNFLFVNLTNLLQPDVKRVQSRASQSPHFFYIAVMNPFHPKQTNPAINTRRERNYREHSRKDWLWQ